MSFAHHYLPEEVATIDVAVYLKGFPIEVCMLKPTLRHFWTQRMLHMFAFLNREVRISKRYLSRILREWLGLEAPVPPLSAIVAFYSVGTGARDLIYPALQIRDAYWDEKMEGITIVVRGPPYLPLALTELRTIVRKWAEKGEGITDDECFKPSERKLTPASVDRLRQIYTQLHAPGLSIEQLETALIEDPRNMAHHDDPASEKPEGRMKQFELLLNRTEPDIRSISFHMQGLTRNDILRMSPQQARRIVTEDMKHDRLSHAAILLALHPGDAMREQYIETMLTRIDGELRLRQEHEFGRTPGRLSLSGPQPQPRNLAAAFVLAPRAQMPLLRPGILDRQIVVLDLECGLRRSPDKTAVLPTLICVMDYHGHVLLHTYVRPPGGVHDPVTHISGVSRQNLATAPDYTVVYPFLHRFFAPQVVLVGHGLDADLRALGIHMPASRVIDTSSYACLKIMAAKLATDAGRPLPTSLRPDVAGPTGLSALVEAITGHQMRKGSVHDPIADCMFTLALFKKCEREILEVRNANADALTTRVLGVGYAIDSVRLSYLRADTALAVPRLEVDRQGHKHEPIPERYDAAALRKPAYLRQPDAWPLPPLPAELARAHEICHHIRDAPFSFSPDAPEAYDGLVANFARALDEEGEPRVGRGAMAEESAPQRPPSTTFPVGVFPPRKTSPVPLSFAIDEDLSGVLALRNSEGAASLRAGEPVQLSLQTELPVSTEEWCRIWAPTF